MIAYHRHVRNIEMSDVEIRLENDDPRPPFFLEDVKGASFINVRMQHSDGIPAFILNNVTGFETLNCSGLPDRKIDKTQNLRF